jgi:hypothetical protein
VNPLKFNEYRALEGCFRLFLAMPGTVEPFQGSFNWNGLPMVEFVEMPLLDPEDVDPP